MGYTGHPKATRLSATLQAAPLLAAGEPKRWAQSKVNQNDYVITKKNQQTTFNAVSCNFNGHDASNLFAKGERAGSNCR